MRSGFVKGIGLVAAMTLGSGLQGEAPAVVRLDGMPSFHQRDARFVAGGRAYCGPTAASNALIWLGEHGYPRLVPEAGSLPEAQRAMIQNLASRMGTYGDGTPIDSFRCGINTYVRSVGYVPGTWASSGASLQSCPDVKLLSRISDQGTVAWLGLGRYAYDALRGTYERRSGHLVTLVGYQVDGPAGDEVRSVVISDPERPGEFRTMALQRLGNGLLRSGWNSAEAAGYWIVGDTTASAGTNPVTILESIQSLTLAPVKE